MALGVLVIFFVTMLVISGLGIALLYLLKNQMAKNILFYALAVWSMMIAILNATSLPSNFLFEQLFAWLLGFLPIIAIIIKVKKPSKTMIPYLLVSSSIIISLFDLFFF